VAVCLPLALAGCLQVKTVSAGEPGGSPTAAPSGGAPSGGAPSSAAPSSAPAAPSAGANEVTPPGTELALGGTIVVPIVYDPSDAVARITIRSVEPAPPAAIKPFLEDYHLEDGPLDFYYVRSTFEVLKGQTSSYYVQIFQELYSTTDDRATEVSTDPDFSTCPPNYEGELTAGQKVEVCEVEALPKGSTPAYVSWRDQEKYSPYEGDGGEVHFTIS